jgi:hypothetical protein
VLVLEVTVRDRLRLLWAARYRTWIARAT